ncbi:MAG TPA: hypothetical protein VK716_14265 [Terracidiphilus sp.]|jgi:hypothetical protein|nr:hypothetical protein [Terracidiphilus sp.]
MAKRLDELREKLLRAGVAPRHVRRTVMELEEHLADLRAEEERGGQSRADAERAALKRPGSMDELAQRVIAQPQFRSLSARAPWAVLGLGPVVGLGALWMLALVILVTGWMVFMPNSETPFVRVAGVAAVYFGLGRALYFAAPVLVGWWVGSVAARQRLRVTWLLLGWALLAWCGGMGQVTAQRTMESPSCKPIAILVGFASPWTTGHLLHVAVILALTAPPYAAWRLWSARTAVE